MPKLKLKARNVKLGSDDGWHSRMCATCLNKKAAQRAAGGSVLASVDLVKQLPIGVRHGQGRAMTVWYVYRHHGGHNGTLSAEEVLTEIKNGNYRSKDALWTPGMDNPKLISAMLGIKTNPIKFPLLKAVRFLKNTIVVIVTIILSAGAIALVIAEHIPIRSIIRGATYGIKTQPVPNQLVTPQANTASEKIEKNVQYKILPIIKNGAMTFGGYPCAGSCNGHIAGYSYSKSRGFTNSTDCPNDRGRSFYEGCIVAVTESVEDGTAGWLIPGSP